MSEIDRIQASESVYTQAGVVPFRYGTNGLEFCLITTRRSGRWAFPKGSIREHESIEAAALCEALEEAGVTGHLVGQPLGQYEYSKRGENHSVLVMLMQVRECTALWKEGTQRDRRWVTYEAALEMLDRPNLIELLRTAMNRLAGAAAPPIDETPLSA